MKFLTQVHLFAAFKWHNDLLPSQIAKINENIINFIMKIINYFKIFNYINNWKKS